MIALHVAEGRPAAISAARDFVDEMARGGEPVTACTAAGAEALGIEVADGSHRVVVAVGGDGTVLEGAAFATATGADIVGINVGRVGFLAEVETTEIGQLVALLANGEHRVKERMTVRATANGQESIGLNDVVIEKVASQQMISVDIRVDGERFLNYRADGVIVATPTGSSAYNLSAGGPLVDPRIAALIITPVAPYSLFSASVALHPAAILRATIQHDRPARCSVDGRILATMAPGDSVHIERGPTLRLIDVTGRSYPETLRLKLRLQEGLTGITGTNA